jgi:hypothetical protein
VGRLKFSPEWVTALATAVQTIVVCVALGVAYYEWKGHTVEREDNERGDKKALEAFRIFHDDLEKVREETPFIEIVDRFSDCKAIKKRLEGEPPPVDAERAFLQREYERTGSQIYPTPNCGRKRLTRFRDSERSHCVAQGGYARDVLVLSYFVPMQFRLEPH